MKISFHSGRRVDSYLFEHFIVIVIGAAVIVIVVAIL